MIILAVLFMGVKRIELNWVEFVYIPRIQTKLTPLDTVQIAVNYVTESFVNAVQC